MLWFWAVLGNSKKPTMLVLAPTSFGGERAEAAVFQGGSLAKKMLRRVTHWPGGYSAKPGQPTWSALGHGLESVRTDLRKQRRPGTGPCGVEKGQQLAPELA